MIIVMPARPCYPLKRQCRRNPATVPYMNPVNRTTCLALALLLSLAVPHVAGAGDTAELPERVQVLEVRQNPEIARQHQRRVGNARAQARREGIIRTLPQLYAYYGDHTAVHHMHGYNRGFTLSLDSAVRRSSRVRDMVDLEALVENLQTIDGSGLTLGELPDVEMIFVEYWRPDCEDCQRVRDDLAEWLEERPLDSALWLRVQLRP